MTAALPPLRRDNTCLHPPGLHPPLIQPDTGQSAASSGYLHRGYAESFQEQGDALALTHAGGWLLRRPVPGTTHHDAMGPYPLLCCHDWSRLRQDLDTYRDQLVAFSAVTDPLGELPSAEFKHAFSRFAPFKEHYIVDLEVPSAQRTHKHHRRNIKRADKHLRIEVVSRPVELLDDWVALYDVLIERHAIRGIPAFSKAIFRRQLAVPGILALRASRETETVGIALWYRSETAAYYHLAAYNEAGYRAGASFALFAEAFDQLQAAGVRWVNLGAGAGTHADGNDGLTRFKAGWATETRPAWFCAEILNPDLYQRLVTERGAAAGDYFPAYRGDDFG